MNYGRMVQTLKEMHPSRMVAIDSHTAGEPTRLIVGGVGPVPGETMREKRLYYMEHYDQVRLQLTREPRGHRDMFAAHLTEPVTPGAHFGLIYMDPRRLNILATVSICDFFSTAMRQTPGGKNQSAKRQTPVAMRHAPGTPSAEDPCSAAVF